MASAVSATLAVPGPGLASSPTTDPVSDPAGVLIDPYGTAEQVNQQVNATTSPAGVSTDTDYTPIAKESGRWALVQGARFDSSGAETRAQYEARAAGSLNGPDEQVTSFDDELTAVAFANTSDGFAGGERKLDCNGDGTPDTYVPVIYSYHDSPNGARWWPTTEGGLLGDCSHPGFVGAIAWIRSTGMAIAVGGSGSYPYREPAYGQDINGNSCPPDQNKPYGANCDQAGLGRAWLYNHGSWQELAADPKTFPLPLNASGQPDPTYFGAPGQSGTDGLHGMSAVAFSPLPGKNFGFAGGLGQIWPFIVKVQGQDGACASTDPNQCVIFPPDGRLPDIGGTDARAEMNSAPQAARPAGQHLATNTVDGYRFKGRVRQIRMASDPLKSVVDAAAVTDGCCAGADAGPQGASLGPANDYPVVLDFANVNLGSSALSSGVGVEDNNWHWRVYAFDPYADQYEHAAYLGVPDQQRRVVQPPNLRQDMPDSFYSLMFQPFGGTERVSVVAAPGGPPAQETPQRPAEVTEPFCIAGDAVEGRGNGEISQLTFAEQAWQPGQLFTVLRSQLSSVRLVSGDGDDDIAYAGPLTIPLLGPTQTQGPPFVGDPSNSQRTSAPNACNQGLESQQQGTADTNRHDTVPDWAVGELGSTQQPGLGTRGLAFCTVCRPTLVPDTLNVGLSDQPLLALSPGGTPSIGLDPSQITGNPTQYRPTTPQQLVAYLQSQLYFTDSYSLNAINYISGTGVAWAVGAHGGITELGGSAGSGLSSSNSSEPSPPVVGARSPAAPPDRTAYDAFDPSGSSPGPVPALGARSREGLLQPTFVWAGAPDASPDYAGGQDSLGEIVMSRDGSEGWGLDRSPGPIYTAMTLFHYSRGQWTRCDPEGIDRVLAPDLACSYLAPLRSYSVGGKVIGVNIATATRIPLEYDSDPSNDDSFSVLALATAYRTSDRESVQPTLLRYAGGFWQLDGEPQVRAFLASHLDFSTCAVQGTCQGYYNEPVQLAFASPNDGWLLQTPPRDFQGSIDSVSRLLHFDGKRWIDCTTNLRDPQGSGVANPTANVPGAGTSDGATGSAKDRKSWCDDPNLLTISADQQTSTTGKIGSSGSTQDRDHFVGMTTAGGTLYLYGSRTIHGQPVPLILCKRHDAPWTSEGCGLDTGLAARSGGAASPLSGEVTALSVAIGLDNQPHGWAALGGFGPPASPQDANLQTPTSFSLLRFDGRAWQPFSEDGPLTDRLASLTAAGRQQIEIVAQGDGGGLLATEHPGGRPGFALYRFDSLAQAWQLVPGDLAPMLVSDWVAGESGFQINAMTSDNQGGVWLGVTSPRDILVTDMVHYTAHPPEPVFSETPSPITDTSDTISGLAGQPDGTVWLATSTQYLYRYKRTTGWDQVLVPGWELARATVKPPAYAIAVNDQGVGVAVGAEGRIADIAGGSAVLDVAAGTVCDFPDVKAPCGTSHNLRAAAVAPDGSALVGGERLSLLWRPGANGAFRAIERPSAAPSATITGLSLPSGGVAYLTTTTGELFRGVLLGTHWSWSLDDTDASDALLTRDPSSARAPAGLNAVAVDASGRGYAAGDNGVVLERTGDGDHPWRRIVVPTSDALTSLLLSGGRALIGGGQGLVLTGSGSDFEVAREADQYGAATGPVVGMAVAGGDAPGQTEAWVATRSHGSVAELYNSSLDTSSTVDSRLFHYTSDPSDMLLVPGGRARALPDAPAPRAGELAFAVFGKDDCHEGSGECAAIGAPGADYATLSGAIASAVAGSAEKPGLAVFTGDASDDAGMSGAVEADAGNGAPTASAVLADVVGPGHVGGVLKLRSLRDWLEGWLGPARVPLFSAIGPQDLSGYRPCSQSYSCLPATQSERVTNDAWRTAFGSAPAPWGSTPDPGGGRYSIVPLADSSTAIRTDRVPDPTGQSGGVPTRLGSASTHYAFDLVDTNTGRAVARMVFADNSHGSLAASDSFQNPLEADGQSAWLDRVLCFSGSGQACSRAPGEPAIVVASVPTYSYASGGDPSRLATDATTFESLLLKDHVTAVMSGSLGINERYWAIAPGVHEPCPGGAYQDQPPAPGTYSCGGVSSGSLDGVTGLAGTLSGLGPPPDPTGAGGISSTQGLTGQGLLPFIVASGAGGTLAQEGGSASDGYWHGYTIVRIPKDGDPAGVIVEQRPILDYLSLSAISHVLQPGQHLQLHGIGREPLSYDTSSSAMPYTAKLDTIDSPAITHRYDLVQANPAQPWLPLVDPSSPAPNHYVPLDPSVATVDRQTGFIQTGSGSHPRVYAIAILSVGGLAASDPIVFEPRRSFTQRTAVLPQLPPLAPPVPLPPVHLAAAAPAPPPPPTNAPPIPPEVASPNLPQLPNVAPPPPVAAITPPAPPPPPAPPTPPSQPSPLPLALQAKLSPVGINATVVPPSPPPVNPAPPSGSAARKEAKQRQAATAKSEEGAQQASDAAGDLASSSNPDHGANMTRLDERHPFTRAQPSALERDLLYGGGLGVAALLMAIAFATVRPTGRRRLRSMAAPAWARRAGPRR